MKNKIILALSALFLLFAFGAFIAAVNVKNTTAVLNNLIKLYQIEDLRHNLVQSVLKVQADLYSLRTPLGNELEAIIENVSSLQKMAQGCTSCHHESDIAAALDDLQSEIVEFQNALSFYITASANKERITELQSNAVFIANDLLAKTEKMSFNAARKIEVLTKKTFIKVERSKNLLWFTLLASCLSGILIAVNLTRAITKPTSELVLATRKIAAGDLGYTIIHQYDAEFGELANHFNTMSSALKNGYSKLQEEITERKLTEEALRESEERYALAARGANDGLWDWDLKTGLVFYSPRWKAMLGLTEEEIDNSPESWFNLVHPEDILQLKAKLTAHIEGHAVQFEDEPRMRHKDGTYRWMLTRGIALRDSAGKAYRMAGSQTDISRRKSAEEQLLHDAFHDALTGLPNRALFMNRLQQVINTAQRRKDYIFAVLFLDLDRFKLTNDSLGHMVGDQLLIDVSKRLSEFIRPSDTVARLGGDEFAILLQDIKDCSGAIHIAQRIQEDLPIPFHILGHEVFTTASIGIALNAPTHERPDQLLREADLAMYQAKANGKSRYEIYDHKMHANIITHLQLENDLRRAIERNEFLVHYQPILSLTTNRVTGFEALVRWLHPTRGLLYPEEFIPIAEETGMITLLGQIVLRESCRTIRRLQKHLPTDPSLSINLNLSSKEFTPLLVEQIQQILIEFDLEPSTLRIEITESTIMGDPVSAAFLLLQLKDLGVGLQIDDFGTGYSSLSYLHNFPIDVLKIDQSFIKRMNINNENLEIVKAIITLAQNLKMEVIAEGVETTEELHILKQLGSDYVQGHFISEPLDKTALENWVAVEINEPATMNTGG